MRILVHDFGAYAFTVQLARELAKRGHVVRYVYLDEEGSVKGDVGVRPTDAPTFSSVGIADDDPLRRSSFVRRFLHDGRYAIKLAAEQKAFQPDVVVSADCPLLSQAMLQRSAKSSGARFVFWLQDLFGEALDAVVSRKSRAAGRILSAPFKMLEHTLLKKSDDVIGIAPSFVNYVRELGVESVHLLPNWAPLDDTPDSPTVWAQGERLPTGTRFLYSGTLGLKHDPQVLATIAKSLSETNGHVVVVTEGEGRHWLEETKRDQDIDNLYLLDFQDAADLPSMLESADVLLAILNADASVFSVPSKVLTYMTAGKPVLAVIPTDNYSAQVIIESDSGIVVAPSRRDEASAAALELLADRELRTRMGQNGISFAATRFDIEAIGDQVEQICGLVDLTENSDKATSLQETTKTKA